MMNESMKKHLVEALNKGVRHDSRKLDEFRKIFIEQGISKSAEGSARVRIGETEVIAGVKLSVEKPYPDTPEQGCLAVGAELLPLSSPDFETGPPRIDSIELARVIDRGVREAKAIDMKKMCIEKGEKAWMVFIDICSINDDGNLLDASGMAVLAALKNAKFPAYDGVEINYKEHTDESIPFEKSPLPVTVYKIGGKFLVDPSKDEESAYDARLTVTTTEDGTLCALQKGGDNPLTIDEVDSMVELALSKVKEIRKNF